jgi:hypothetical protein
VLSIGRLFRRRKSDAGIEPEHPTPVTSPNGYERSLVARGSDADPPLALAFDVLRNDALAAIGRSIGNTPIGIPTADVQPVSSWCSVLLSAAPMERHTAWAINEYPYPIDRTQ